LSALAGGIALGLPTGVTAAGPRGAGFGKAKSVLLIYASGGQSQLELWDPKPEAPVEVRGAFGSIATSVPGLRFGELMPRIAKLANRFTVLRSVCHDDRDHGSASYLALTGQYHLRKSGNPPVQPTDLPTYGAILNYLQRERRFRLPGVFPFASVHVNAPAYIPEILAPGQFAGLLGKSCEPLTIGHPTEDMETLAALDDQPQLTRGRRDERRSLLEKLEARGQALEGNRAARDVQDLYRQAYRLLAAPQVRRAFDLTGEPAAVRERYGMHRSGQSCLLARRLVEAGAPWVTLIWNHSNRGQDKMPDNSESYGWDTHNDIFSVLHDHLMPRFDQSLSALLEDMDQRGLLEETLVVCMGEFGRAPLVTRQLRMAGTLPGRDHWPDVYSIMLAGAGVARGGVFGASDRRSTAPQSHAVGPWDVAATMFHAIGVDPSGHYVDPSGRPFPIALGSPILGVYS
jgi:hypothetical protein